MTVTSSGDSGSDTCDIGDTGNTSWKNSFGMFVYIVVG